MTSLRSGDEPERIAVWSHEFKRIDKNELRVTGRLRHEVAARTTIWQAANDVEFIRTTAQVSAFFPANESQLAA